MKIANIKKVAIALIASIIILLVLILIAPKITDYKNYKSYERRELSERLAIVDTLLQHPEAFLDDSFKNISKDELISFLKKPNNLNYKFFIADGSSVPGVADFKTAMFDTLRDAIDGIGILGEKYTSLNSYLNQSFHKLTIRVPFSLNKRDYLLQALKIYDYNKVKQDNSAEYFEGKPDIY
jgi:hypothetical protein